MDKLKRCCCHRGSRFRRMITRAKTMFVRQQSNLFLDSLKSTKKKFKPWENMNPEEKKERIQYLWKQARRYHWQLRIMFRLSQITAGGHGKGQLVEDDETLMTDNKGEEDAEKWYLINEEKTVSQVWTMIMNFLTIYTLFTTPFV